MPEYTIRDADTGQQLRVRGDTPPSPRDMEELFAAHYTTTTPSGPQIPAGTQSTIGEEVARGIGQVVSSSRAGIGALLGDGEEAALKGIERGEEQARAYGEAPSFERVRYPRRCSFWCWATPPYVSRTSWCYRYCHSRCPCWRSRRSS